MGNLLDTPATEKHTIRHSTDEGLAGGATGMQGYRREMEDAHILCEMPSAANHTMLAVFDGHGGSGAAEYAAEHLLSVVEQSAPWKQYLEQLANGGGDNDKELIGKALSHSFMAIDVDIRRHQEEDRARNERERAKVSGTERGQIDYSMYGDISDTSGCTAVVCVLNEKYIVCANAGDSRCVMGTGKTTKPLSDDHKPNNAPELSRIEAAGGYVSGNRVEGNLAVSRAFGDFEFKDVNQDPEKCKVTALPDITTHDRNSTDDVLILACDGVWDVLSSEDAVNLAREIMGEGEADVGLLCEEIVDYALLLGSKDNISCVCLKLPSALVGDGGGVAVRRARRDAERRDADTRRALAGRGPD